MPGQIYPLFEIALRAALGESSDAHRRRIAALSASFARVAADNPLAWFRDGKTAAEIGTVGAENRMIAFPYPKFMNAIMEVDQAAAVVMTTAATARALAVAPGRAVYLHGGGDTHDIWFLKDRVDYHSSPGMAAAYQAALTQAGVTPEALGPVDLYSCFPVAPQFGARLLGLPCDGSRTLTVTGGLPYFGGPGNDYAMHAIATMVERLRRAPDALGLVSGLGWYMTKHAVGIYGAAPPTRPWQRIAGEREEAQARIEALPHPAYVPTAEGPARVETYTVLHDRDGAAVDAIVIARLESGARTFANVGPDPDTLAVLAAREMVGAPGRVATAGGRNRFRLVGG
jgi:acetyl-CoA C-acetyltransferase